MVRAVDRQESRRIDPGVDLGGRQAAVAQKLLDRAQVRPVAQEMAREAVPERVRRGGLGQAEGEPQTAHRGLHDPLAQGTAAGPSEERCFGRQREGAGLHIGSERLGDRRQDRNEPLATPFAADP